MWGSGPDDIFGLEADLGDPDRHGQVIWHYDGIDWKVIHRDNNRLVAIWGIKPSGYLRKVFVLKQPIAMGANTSMEAGTMEVSTLLYCDMPDCTDMDTDMDTSSAWSTVTTTATERQHAIWGRDPSD